ncbi:unnamed protein product, partial [Closterium sp. Naga37s-1]
LLSIRKPKLSNGKTWGVLDAKAFTYTLSWQKALDSGAGLPFLEHDFLTIPVYLKKHYSLVIVCEPSRIFKPAKSEDNAPLDMVLYDSALSRTDAAAVFGGCKLVLSVLAKETHPHVDTENVDMVLKEANCIVLG